MLKNVKYLLTTHDIAKMPQDDLDEVVILGRSNVGKSTFINLISNNKKLALISSKPGKTKALSLFDVDNKFRIVDVPGYGHAMVSKKQHLIFAEMIDTYLSQRPNVKSAIILLDGRRGVLPIDFEIINYLVYHQIPFNVIGTKLDKITQSQKAKFIKQVKQELQITPIIYSATKKTNLDKVLNIFSEFYG